jgi:tetraacyldisaccharide 4'-kinase
LKTKGIYFLYRALQAFGLPVFLLYFLYRGVRNRGYWRSLWQRFGHLPRSFRQTGPGAIWLHAVSVGEVLACLELLRRLRTAFPQTRLFVSSSTLAGKAAAAEKAAALIDGVFYAPVDYAFAVRRVLRTLQPSVVVVAETEIWPNLFREVKRTGAGLLLVNGRISDRAFPRDLRFRGVFAAVLAHVDTILAQSPAIAERFRALGAPAERLREGGNLKYDFEARTAAADSPPAQWLERTAPGPVWIAASTMPPASPGDVDEDDVVIAAYADLRRSAPGLRLILAPRRPERFDSAARKLENAGIGYERRSAGASNGTQVLLLDSIGELSGLFAAADVVFMGGTLAARGGHNILEPALFARPVIVGPHMENFQAIADEFRTAGALVEIADGSALASATALLLSDTGRAGAIGRQAKACVEARRGATERAVKAIRELQERGVPRFIPAQPWFALRWLLARLWRWGARHRQARDRQRMRRLPAPVISVGNITMGGTGKTPCVLRLAEELGRRGVKPGILTRGYRRGSPERELLLAPGANVRAIHSGDEPQIFVRSALSPVGIGADRYRTGTLLLDGFGADVLLLDDGFQHLRLARDLDIVLIDALQPFGAGEVFPLGRLREPLEGLARAGMVVITRSGFSDLTPAIERVMRRYNSTAPVFRARVEPRAWVEHATAREWPLAERPFDTAGAFCGLGNPLSFRRTLESLGVRPADWVEFEDHHHYRPHEMRRIAHQMELRGATALVTTEKDAVNLCEDCDALVAPLKIYWLKVSMAVEREAEFFAEIRRRIGMG